jgi:hypothetical protein
MAALEIDGALLWVELARSLRRSRRTAGRFHDGVALPCDVENDAVSASMDEGEDRARPQGSLRAPGRIPTAQDGVPSG